MCQITNMGYNNGRINIEVSSIKDLTNYLFELYVFDFVKGKYSEKPFIAQPIGSMHVLDNTGTYYFKYEIPGRKKFKCVISKDGDIKAVKERFIGSKYKISIKTEASEIGKIYYIGSEISLSKKLIYYKSPVSTTNITLPEDLDAGRTMKFLIENFSPNFEVSPIVKECIYFE